MVFTIGLSFIIVVLVLNEHRNSSWHSCHSRKRNSCSEHRNSWRPHCRQSSALYSLTVVLITSLLAGPGRPRSKYYLQSSVLFNSCVVGMSGKLPDLGNNARRPARSTSSKDEDGPPSKRRAMSAPGPSAPPPPLFASNNRFPVPQQQNFGPPTGPLLFPSNNRSSAAPRPPVLPLPHLQQQISAFPPDQHMQGAASSRAVVGTSLNPALQQQTSAFPPDQQTQSAFPVLGGAASSRAVVGTSLNPALQQQNSALTSDQQSPSSRAVVGTSLNKITFVAGPGVKHDLSVQEVDRVAMHMGKLTREKIRRLAIEEDDVPGLGPGVKEKIVTMAFAFGSRSAEGTIHYHIDPSSIASAENRPAILSPNDKVKLEKKVGGMDKARCLHLIEPERFDLVAQSHSMKLVMVPRGGGRWRGAVQFRGGGPGGGGGGGRGGGGGGNRGRGPRRGADPEIPQQDYGARITMPCIVWGRDS